MGDAFARVAAADVDHPFAEDRGLDQGQLDDRAADPRPVEDELLQGLARHVGDIAASEHLDRVVGRVEEDVLKVDRIAWDAHRHDLARPVAGHLLAIGEAVDQDSAIGGQGPLADQVASCVEPAHPVRQVENGLTIGRVERAVREHVLEEAS